MNGSRAVFEFSTPRNTPAFDMTYCCTPEDKGTRPYRGLIGYHGEFEVNPETGAVLRLAMETYLDIDQNPKLPVMRWGWVVEYGPVQIGGKTYISPRRGVPISRERAVQELHEWETSFVVYAPFETLVNDFRFTEFHKFGSESRMLAGFEEVPSGKEPETDGGKQPAKPQ